jgi:hypothetical protein
LQAGKRLGVGRFRGHIDAHPYANARRTGTTGYYFSKDLVILAATEEML